MTDELKPVRCGCGGEAKVRTYIRTDHIEDPYHYVQCDECRISTVLYLTEAEAIEAWNRAMGERSATEVSGNQVHLCDSCKYAYPECPDSKVIFGDGIGHDNICACSNYEARNKAMSERTAKVTYKLRTSDGVTFGFCECGRQVCAGTPYCSNCGKKIPAMNNWEGYNPNTDEMLKKDIAMTYVRKSKR